MAYAEQRSGAGRVGVDATMLAGEWRRLRRAATAVAVFTSPLFFVVLYDRLGLSLGWALLATLGSVITVTLPPLTIGEPHTHEPGHEEIWAAIEGESVAFLGSQLRIQKPGMAYMLRPDVTMTHSNVNYGDTPIKFLWFSVSRTSDAGTIVVNQPLTAPASSTNGKN